MTQPIIKHFIQQQAYKIIETVFKSAAIVFECHWTMLLKSPDCRMFLGHILVNFLERELVSETLGVTESTLTSYYLVRSNKKLRLDNAYQLKYTTAYNYVMATLRGKDLVTKIESKI